MAISLLSLVSYFGALSPIIDITSHFRWQYLLLLTLFLIILLAFKKMKIALLVGIVAAINTVSLAIFWIPQGTNGLKSGATLSILNMNLQYGNANFRLVGDAVNRENPDVITLEELSPQMLEHLKALLPNYPFVIALPRFDSAGIGMFSKTRFVRTDLNPLKLPLSLVIRGDVEVGTKNVSILTIHACGPTSSACCEVDKQIADKLSEIRRTEMHHSTILIGDMNSSPWSIIFNQLLKAGPFIDSERGHGVQCSWPTSLPLARIPIDHCFFTNDWLCTERKLSSSVGSDHFPLFVKLDSRDQ